MTFEDALRSTEQWVSDAAVKGVSTAIWHRGEIVAQQQVGESQPGVPVRPDTLFALASVSKPFTAATLMRLVEQGELTLDMPVSAILPEFGETDDPFADDAYPQLEALRDRVTLRMLLSHTSGLPENAGVKRFRLRDQPSLEHILDVMCGVPLQEIPGTVLRYSNVGPAVAARVAERVAGRNFHELLHDEVFAPRGLTNVIAQPTAALDARITLVEDPSAEGTPVEGYNSEYWRHLGIPWGGYYGTSQDVARFAGSFIPGYVDHLNSDLASEMITDQVHGASGGVDSAGVRWDPGFWGLGWEVKGSKQNHWTGTLTSPQTFCHWGQSGTLVWGDPTRELVLAVFGNRTVLKRPWPLSPARWSHLSDDIVRIADASQ
ncbi:MAG: serine hydrolase domain-containing protein [Thermomicrobiales bacterium]